jgi:hypothetical protein
MAVVEDNRREPSIDKPLGEWRKSARLDATNAMRHHNRRMWRRTVRQIQPCVDLAAVGCRDP